MLLLQLRNHDIPWAFVSGTAIATFAIVVGGMVLLRRLISNTTESDKAKTKTPAHSEDASAFMAASMQAVIKKLRDQEKELERLHREERERAESTERLSEEVTRNMPAGLIVVNSQRIIASANPAAEQTLGNRGLKFRRFSEVLGEDSDLSKLIAECIATGKIFRREQIRHLNPAHELRTLGVTISPIRKADAEITGALCLLTDLTELASLQKQMQLKDNLAALGELSAGIAHEFKNALATISGYAQMISAEQPSPEAADNARRILEQTDNITHVVTEFLKYARPLEISGDTVDLHSLIERTVADASGLAPTASFEIEGDFGEAIGDESLLRQAFLNLLRNAAEACAASKEPGRILIRGERFQRDARSMQKIVFLDSGPGFAPGAADKLFVPFFTTKSSGTGLGLPVVQKILLHHGGHVEAQNRSEGGAAFTVTLPLNPSAQEAVK